MKKITKKAPSFFTDLACYTAKTKKLETWNVKQVDQGMEQKGKKESPLEFISITALKLIGRGF